MLWRVQLHTMNCSHDLVFEQFTINGRMCFFVTEILRYSVSAPVHDLVTVGTVG